MLLDDIAPNGDVGPGKPAGGTLDIKLHFATIHVMCSDGFLSDAILPFEFILFHIKVRVFIINYNLIYHNQTKPDST